MSQSGPRWGIVATILAPPDEILRFAAHHLRLGAHRLYLFLDAPSPVEERLRAHPRVRVICTDERYWRQRGGRPRRHQFRQVRNATRAYARASGEIAWLAHIDVDEFLEVRGGHGCVADHLAAVPSELAYARVPVVEALYDPGFEPGERMFKVYEPNGLASLYQRRIAYPAFGRYLKGGFLGHVVGKVFLRTGLPDITFRIHTARQGAGELAPTHPLTGLDLCHFHAPTPERFLSRFAYRHTHGAYRAEIGHHSTARRAGKTLHELFEALRAEEGEAGLLRFYHEICTARPELVVLLEQHGHLRRYRALGAREADGERHGLASLFPEI